MGMCGTGQQCVICSGGRLWLRGATATKQKMAYVWVWHHVFLSVSLIPHANPGFGFSQIPLSCEICFSHSSFSSGPSTFLPIFPHRTHPKLFFLVFFFLNKQSHMCVGHSFDRHTGTDAAFAGFILPVKWRCNSLSTKQWHHHVSLFLFAQSNAGETVSHMSRSLHLNFNACVFFYLHLLTL